MSILFSIIAFIVALTILISFHEFGHFWVARKMGVKVLRFSVGFGKPLWIWRDKYQTEFAFSRIPLGGYVKMLDEAEGEVPEDQLQYAFNRKSLWQRIAIVCAGPVFNIIFAILAFWLVFSIGVKSIAPVIGNVKPDSPAQQAGLVAHQEILAIDNHPTYSWRDIQLELLRHAGRSKPLAVTVKKRDERIQQTKQIDISSLRINSQQPLLLQRVGITPYIPSIPAVIAHTEANYPAVQAGLKPGDKIIAVDGKPLKDWNALRQLLQNSKDDKNIFRVERDGQQFDLTLTPKVVQEKDGSSVKIIGAISERVDWPADMIRVQRYKPWIAWWPAIKRTTDLSFMTLQFIGKMVTGQVSLRALSGPIGIAQGAGITASLGFTTYLEFLALISISLAVLNILPIPLLDGGHLLYYLVEGITGRPVSDKTKMRGIIVGLLFIVMLTCIAFLNDLSRLFGF